MENRSSNQESPSALWPLSVYLAVVFVGGALISPWIYFAVQRAAEHSETWHSLTKHPFHRFVHRALLAFAIIGLWPFCKAAGLRWRNLGITASRAEWKRFASGLAVGFVSLACIAAFALGTGTRTFQPPANVATLLGTALAAALGVGFIEEVIFRGALFGSLRTAYRWQTALLISSGIYALVHFFSRPAAPPEINWLSGFFILKEMLRGFVDLQTLIPGFLNITLGGAILAMGYQYTGTLSFSFGLHAGWIFWMQSYGRFTKRSGTGNEWLWGTTKLTDGWIAMLVLIALLLAIRHWLPRRSQEK